MKYLYLILISILLLSCSSDPSDLTGPCTDKKIIGFSTDEFPTSPFGVRQVNLTFGEFNGNGTFTTIANPTQLVSINRPSPNDANAYNANLNVYSFLMRDTNKIINFNRANSTISEVDLPVGYDNCKGLTYSVTTNKYYTVQITNASIMLHEIDNITSSPVTVTNTRVLYSGTDAADAIMYSAHASLITDGLGELYFLIKKNLIRFDISNFSIATINYYDLNSNSFTSPNQFSGLEYDQDNNRLLFLHHNYATGTLLTELREVSLPLTTSAYGNQIVDLTTFYTSMDFNSEFHSTVLVCDGSYIITNHRDNQANLETKIITINASSTVSMVGVSNHVFGLQAIN